MVSRDVRRLAHVKQVTVRSRSVGLHELMGSVAPGLIKSGEDGAEGCRFPATRAKLMAARTFQGAFPYLPQGLGTFLSVSFLHKPGLGVLWYQEEGGNGKRRGGWRADHVPGVYFILLDHV